MICLRQGTEGGMSEPTDSLDPADDATDLDPDADPANMNPRDDRDREDYEGDPDADPANMNPRDG
jgi:hypothetical protein